MSIFWRPHRDKLQRLFLLVITMTISPNVSVFIRQLSWLERFETERFTIAPISAFEARSLLAVLLQDELLASRVDWMEEKSQNGAMQQAFGIELMCSADKAKVWTIIERSSRMQIGAVLARYSVAGIDVEVLVASQFWDCDVTDEVAPPVVDWLEKNVEINLTH
jgi:hypothetical protein